VADSDSNRLKFLHTIQVALFLLIDHLIHNPLSNTCNTYIERPSSFLQKYYCYSPSDVCEVVLVVLGEVTVVVLLTITIAGGDDAA
jgi:hypothetical protein